MAVATANVLAVCPLGKVKVSWYVRPTTCLSTSSVSAMAPGTATARSTQALHLRLIRQASRRAAVSAVTGTGWPR